MDLTRPRKKMDLKKVDLKKVNLICLEQKKVKNKRLEVPSRQCVTDQAQDQLPAGHDQVDCRRLRDLLHQACDQGRVPDRQRPTVRTD